MRISPAVPVPALGGNMAVAGYTATSQPSFIHAIIPAQANTGVTIGGTASGGTLSATSTAGDTRPDSLAASPAVGSTRFGNRTTSATQ